MFEATSDDTPTVVVFADGSYSVIPDDQTGVVHVGMDGPVAAVNWRGLVWTVPITDSAPPEQATPPPKRGRPKKVLALPPVVEAAEDAALGVDRDPIGEAY